MKVKRAFAKFIKGMSAPGNAINDYVVCGHRPIAFFILAGLWCTVIPIAFFTSGFLSNIIGWFFLLLALGIGVSVFGAFCSAMNDVVATVTMPATILYMKSRDYLLKTDEAAAQLERKDLQYFIDWDQKQQKKKRKI